MAERIIKEVRKEFPEESEELLRKIHASLSKWRTTGKKAGNPDNIRQNFNTLQASAQVAGYQEVSRLSHAVTRLMNQYGDDRTSDYDSERVLINLLEEMHDGLAAVIRMTPADTGVHLQPLTGIVESLLPAAKARAPDIAGQLPAQEQPPDSSLSRTADDSRLDDVHLNENRKFSYLLDFSGELGLTRSRLGNTMEQMRRDLNTLKYYVNQIRGAIESMEPERDEASTASARKINLQLDALIQVERKLRERVSTFAGTLNQQSHYGERLTAGLLKAGMVKETMTLSRVLLVRVGAWRFAIRTATIERAAQVKDEEISVIDGHRTLQTDDKPIPIIDLSGEIRKSGPGIERRRRSVVLIRCENRTSAFEVDRFEGTVEAAISAPGTQLASIRGITGATVLADGRIVAVLDPAKFPDCATIRESVSK